MDGWYPNRGIWRIIHLQKTCFRCGKTPLKNTIFINIFAIILALGITIPLGIKTAVKRNSTFDKVVQVLTIIGYSLPVFIICLLFIYFFAVILGWFPVSGMSTPNFQGTETEAFLDKIWHMVLPLGVMTIGSLGGMTRYVRAAMTDAHIWIMLELQELKV